MSYELFTIPAFDKAVKRLKRKYPRIKVDLARLADELRDNPFAGVAIPGYSHRLWKIRMASVDMQVGKRGGFRVIYALEQTNQACYLLFIYPKATKSDVTQSELEEVLLELERFLFGDGSAR